MFKRNKNKPVKIGIHTPKFRNPTPPPPPTSGSNAVKIQYGQVDSEKVVVPVSTTTFEDYCKPKQVNKFAVGTRERLNVLLSMHDDMVKIENADIYWSEKHNMIAVCTTQEWKDYLTGKRDTPFVEKENEEC